MAVKVRSDMSDYPNNFWAKVSLVNSGIPGRKSKQYFTSHYTYSTRPSQFSRVFTDSRAPIVGELNYAAVNPPLPANQIPYLRNPWPGAVAGELLDTATSSLFEKVLRGRGTDFNGAVFLGEMSSTWGMFVGTAGRVVNAYRAVRRGNMAAARKALGVPPKSKASKGLANNWLELQYGWLPLLSDIDSAARKLADRIRSRPVVIRVSGSASHSQTTTNAFYDYVDSYRSSPGMKVLAETFSARVGIAYTVSDETVALASELGFTNPALIAWELLPLSFVLDWIVSVGDWLQAISAFHGLSFYDGYSSIKGDSVLVTVVPGFSHTAYKGIGVGYDEHGEEVFATVADYLETATPSSIRSSTSGFSRNPMAAFPNAPPPKLDPKGSWKKAMTSWALLRQRMR